VAKKARDIKPVFDTLVGTCDRH